MYRYFTRSFCAVLFTLATTSAQADLVEYNFDINTKIVNFTGEPVEALTVGGGIPGPLIEAKLGDTLRVTFHNRMKIDSSIHWHGILLPNDQDGVPYLTTQPIKAESSFTFEFPVIHTGTYWYHSHTGLQEQRGVYGPIVFRSADEDTAENDQIVVLSDWTNENPKQVLANLKKDDHYYALKKGLVQSWDKVIAHGWPAIKNRVQSAWTRMGPMDVSDVGYDAFLANGAQESQVSAEPMQQKKLRIINAAASSYFNLEYAGGPMRIVAADGVDIEPLKVQRLKIAIAETYDVLITAPHHGAAEFRATSEDSTGYSSVFIGDDGERFYAPDIPKPNPYLMDHSMHGNHTMGSMNDMQGMEHTQEKADGPHAGHQKPAMSHGSMMHHGEEDAAEVIPYLQDYEAIRSPEKTTLPIGREWREIELNLTGNMERYVWGFNGKTLRESDKILIKKGENVRFRLKNETMMNHPVHLHGHFFRVVNKQREYSPLKHTVNVPSMSEVVIEFAANEEKDWFFHCHNLYHMKTGMSRVISYSNERDFDKTLMSRISADPWFNKGHLLATNEMLEASLSLMNTRNTLGLRADYGFDHNDFEVDAKYSHHLSRFFALNTGLNIEGEHGQTETNGYIGLSYTLPLLIETEVEFDTSGELEISFQSDLQLTSRIHAGWEWEYSFKEKHDEYRISLSYELSKKWLISAVHDSTYRSSIGVQMNF